MKRLTFFTMLDIVVLLIWLIIIFGYAFYIRSKYSGLDYYKYYLPHLLFKVTFGFIFALVYIFYYKGGDTIAYWDMAGCMNKLFSISPEWYFQELFSDPSSPGYINHYNGETGYPPGWVMREHQGFFISKIVSFFTFVTANSYLTISLLFSVISARVSWRFYEMVKEIVPVSSKWFIYGVLFIPSVGFWCTGISKDALVLISIFSIITNVFALLHRKAAYAWWNIILILVHMWILYNVRSVVLMTLFIPLFIAASLRLSNRFQEYIHFKRMVQFGITVISITLFFLVIQSYGEEVSVEKYIKEAEIVQKDFTNNTAYTGKKYTLEVTDYSPLGMLQVFPAAVIAGWYRPFPWEALSPTLLLNGVESVILLFLTFRFFLSGRKKRVREIRKNEFLIFCFFFVIIFGFIMGFSSIIFGVLVRLRAPLLPFLMILFMVKPLDEETAETERLPKE